MMASFISLHHFASFSYFNSIQFSKTLPLTCRIVPAPSNRPSSNSNSSFIALLGFTLNEVILLLLALHEINKTHSCPTHSGKVNANRNDGGQCWSYWMVWALVETRGAQSVLQESETMQKFKYWPKSHCVDVWHNGP